MDFDAVSIAQHAGLLFAFFAFCWLWVQFGRFVFGWGAIALFCVGQYGWALLAVLLWSTADSAHRRFMAEQRARGYYHGPWID